MDTYRPSERKKQRKINNERKIESKIKRKMKINNGARKKKEREYNKRVRVKARKLKHCKGKMELFQGEKREWHMAL